MLHVHKFGGTSVGDASRIGDACALVAACARADIAMVVVVSAMTGVTNALLAAIAAVDRRDLPGAVAGVAAIDHRHREAIDGLGVPDAASLHEERAALIGEVELLLRAARTTGVVGPRARDRIQAVGEKLSARMFAARLRADGFAATALDADDFLETDAVFGEATPLEGLFERTTRGAIAPVVDAGAIAVVTGFCGCAPDGSTTTLGRGGSDYSATLVASALDADEVVIWTDVAGVYTASPKIVPEARVIPQLNYREAGELAYYGAKVLHPRTLKPVAGRGIPVVIRNTFAPAEPGTRIDRTFTPGSHPVKGITAIESHALISLEGTGMAGVPGVAARLFGALAREGISVTMISQSSAESSICAAVPMADADAAEVAIRREFRLDISHGDVEDLRRQPDVALLAAVGLGMAQTPGIAGRLARTLGASGTSIRAIAQGSSELNITFAVDQSRVQAAIGALHSELGLHRVDTGDAEARAFDLIVLGWGNIARAVAHQVETRNESIFERFGLRGRVVCVADRSGYLLDPTGLEPSALEAATAAKRAGRGVATASGGVPGTLADATRAALAFRLTRPVVVDLTDADGTDAVLQAALGAGCDVVTANKKPLAGTREGYEALRTTARAAGRVLRAEATVGAGLPVVDTLEMLLVTGDRLTRADGCLSGTLAFVLGAVERGQGLADAVREAAARGYTEPDPYVDLSGADVARKALIISRIAGFAVPPEAITVEGLVPPTLAGLPRTEFFDSLRAHETALAARVAAAAARGCVVRYVARVEPDRISVGPVDVPQSSPLGSLRGTDNMVVFHSERYADTPLVVQGPGAGVEVTAMGVFGDIVRIVAERSG
ncbi:MAG: aspartate kinase [Myxococcales bacterium]|nr:aspartate kinase [Myxococcales bacterium]